MMPYVNLQRCSLWYTVKLPVPVYQLYGSSARLERKVFAAQCWFLMANTALHVPVLALPVQNCMASEGAEPNKQTVSVGVLFVLV